MREFAQVFLMKLTIVLDQSEKGKAPAKVEQIVFQSTSKFELINRKEILQKI